MSRKTYHVHVEGLEALDLSLVALRDLCSWLAESTQRVTRLRVEGRSVVRGTVPRWLEDAVDLRVAAYEPGSVNLAISAPSLHESLSPQFGQEQMLFGSPPPDTTSFDLALRAMDDAAHGRSDSEWLDAGVLEALSLAEGLFQRGATAIAVGCDPANSLTLTPTAMVAISQLARRTPGPKVDRVSGILDELKASTASFVLRLDDAQPLRGLLGPVSLDTVKPLLGARVVVDGRVTFKPSGDALRIDADSVSAASERDVVWSRSPRGEVAPLLATGREAVVGSGSLADVYGRWPGDESDDEVIAALAELS